jgi:hypothetical protein
MTEGGGGSVSKLLYKNIIPTSKIKLKKEDSVIYRGAVKCLHINNRRSVQNKNRKI